MQTVRLDVVTVGGELVQLGALGGGEILVARHEERQVCAGSAQLVAPAVPHVDLGVVDAERPPGAG